MDIGPLPVRKLRKSLWTTHRVLGCHLDDLGLRCPPAVQERSIQHGVSGVSQHGGSDPPAGAFLGAGDQRYLAVVSAVTTLGYLLAARAVIADGGLIALWPANTVWMVLRLVTLGVRARGHHWLVLGPAARRGAGA